MTIQMQAKKKSKTEMQLFTIIKHSDTRYADNGKVFFKIINSKSHTLLYHGNWKTIGLKSSRGGSD